MLKFTFLGTGTSHGVPMIGCDCAVCRSTDPRNRRRRSCATIAADGFQLVIDTPPDFRDQVLTFGVRRVDAVLLTHAHADHVFGFDDLRRFSANQQMTIPVYGSAATLDAMRRAFRYVTEDSPWLATAPRVEFIEIDGRMEIGPVTVESVAAPHGPMHVYGYRVEYEGRALGYLPDCSALDEELIARWGGLDLMVLDAMRRRPHPTHLCLQEAVAALQAIGAEESYLTHLSHDLEHAHTATHVPAGIRVPYDGLTLTWSGPGAPAVDGPWAVQPAIVPDRGNPHVD